MQAKTQRLSPNVLAAAAIVGLLIVVLGTWFLVIAPKRNEAADLDRQIEATRVLLSATERRPAAAEADPDAQMARLSVAVPETLQMSAVVLELNRIAERALVRIDQITPAPPVPQAGYQTQPISVTLQGTFFAISDFVRLLRAEADIQKGAIIGAGRVYSVDNISFVEGESKYPILIATVSISTVFGATAVQPQGSAGDVVSPEPASAAAGGGS